MIELSVESSFDFSAEDYAQLYRRCGRSAFQHPIWLSAFYEHLPKTSGLEAAIVTGRFAQTGELALLVPLVKRSADRDAPMEYAFLGVTDYACPLVLPEADVFLQKTPVLRTLRKDDGTPETFLIQPIRPDDRGIWRTLLGVESGMLDYCAHELPLGPAYQTRDILGPDGARDLERKRRRLKERGEVRFEILESDHARQAIVEAARLRAGRFRDDPLQKPEFVSFYADIAAAGSKAGYSITCRLSCAGVTVGILFGITWRRTFYYLLLACDYEKFARHSPGYLIFDHVLTDWSQRGGKIFDFTVGDEPFKARFGAKPVPMFRSPVEA
jgi:CelD/BcsL family acetyltransferase involved in cellulose biosynthesis